ncbi:hypothetical protein JCM10207_004113 [Rhodosporidiobolus poonsookiae]
MASTAPVLALVGATGLVGSALLESFLTAVQDHKLSSLRILTSSPSSPKLARARSTPNVDILEVNYSDQRTLDDALNGADVLVSAMGASETELHGRYEENKEKLVEAAVKGGVKVYVPSSWGTDYTGKNQEIVNSPMFANKLAHFEKAQKRGLHVLEFYNALILEISFSDWLGIPISSPSPTWTIPTPSHPVAFTSLTSLGPSALSAILQTLRSPASPVPSRLRIYSDSLTLDEAADLWEHAAGGKVERVYKTTEELKERYEEIRPTLKPGMLGPAIPLMISLGGFDHTTDNANAVLNVGEFAFKPETVAEFMQQKAAELKQSSA